MPDVVGKRLDEIASRIRAEGFQLGKLSYRRASGTDAGATAIVGHAMVIDGGQTV